VPDTTFDDEKKLIFLDIDVDEGKQFYVRSIEFQGNTDGVPNLVEGFWRRASAFYATACFAFTSGSLRKIAFSAQRSL
jgi:hypothetical protein